VSKCNIHSNMLLFGFWCPIGKKKQSPITWDYIEVPRTKCCIKSWFLFLFSKKQVLDTLNPTKYIFFYFLKKPLIKIKSCLLYHVWTHLLRMSKIVLCMSYQLCCSQYHYICVYVVNIILLLIVPSLKCEMFMCCLCS